MGPAPRTRQGSQARHLAMVDRSEGTPLSTPHPGAHLHDHGPRMLRISLVARDDIELTPTAIAPVGIKKA